MGIDDTVEIARFPEVMSYLLQVASFLPEKPLLVPDEFLVNNLADILA